MRTPETRQSRDGITKREFLSVVAALTVGGLLTEGGRRLANWYQSSGVHSKEDVEEHIRSSRIVWQPAGEIAQQDCLDGRGTQCAVGTAGGNAGDFAMKIGALQDATGRRFTKAQVGNMFDRHREVFPGRFYMHTDDHALHHLAHELGVSDQEILAVLHDPQGHRVRLMNLLKDPKSMGCGHAARLKTHAGTDEYPGITPEIMDAVMENFFARKWDRDRNMDYAVLHGEHEEKSVLKVSTDAPFDARTIVPMIQPSVIRRSDGRPSSLFVIHPQVEQQSERAWVEQALEISRLADINVARCLQLMREYRRAHLLRTARDLVNDQKFFDAKYDPASMRIAVEEAA